MMISICSLYALLHHADKSLRRLSRSAIGSVLIVAGLYMVLWGKGREMDKPAAGLDSDKGDEETGLALGLKGKPATVSSNRVDAVTPLPPVFCATRPNKDDMGPRNGSN
jgi:hypothetical protein